MRAMSAKLLLKEQRKRQAPRVESAGGRAPYSDIMLNPSARSERDPADGEGEGHDAEAGAEGRKDLGGVEGEEGGDAATAGHEGGGSAEYVEFLPVEWFTEVKRLEVFVLFGQSRLFVRGGVFDGLSSLSRFGT